MVYLLKMGGFSVAMLNNQMVSLPEFTMYRSEKLVDQGRNLRGNQCIGLSWTILDMACLRTSSGKLSPWYSWVYITMFHDMEQNIFHFKNLSQKNLPSGNLRVLWSLMRKNHEKKHHFLVKCPSWSRPLAWAIASWTDRSSWCPLRQIEGSWASDTVGAQLRKHG